MNKKISTIEYNNRTVYECFNNSFIDDSGSPYFYLTPITIADRSIRNLISHYNSDLLPYTISVASENSVSTLTTPSDYPKLLLLTSDDPKHLHAMKKDENYHGRIKRGYCYRKHD